VVLLEIIPQLKGPAILAIGKDDIFILTINPCQSGDQLPEIDLTPTDPIGDKI
jgi:hypothetical protein